MSNDSSTHNSNCSNLRQYSGQSLRPWDSRVLTHQEALIQWHGPEVSDEQLSTQPGGHVRYIGHSGGHADDLAAAARRACLVYCPTHRRCLVTQLRQHELQ